MTWDLNNQLPLLVTENGSSGSLIADYQYNPVDQIQGEATSAGAFYHHHDLLGSVTDITDTNGALQRSYSYTAFGEGTQTDVATSPPTNRFTYTGEYKEPTTSAAGYYLRARNYAPDTGRFTSRDSYTAGQDTPAESPYAYVGNGPTHRYDPAGTCWWIPGSGDGSCWTSEIPGTELIPFEPAMKWIGNSIVDTCTSGSDYAKANGRWGWTGCVDEFTGMGAARRGVDSFQQGDAVNGTFQCLGAVGQFGLLFLPGPRVPAGTTGSTKTLTGNRFVNPGAALTGSQEIAILPDFNSRLSAVRHYSDHVLGVRINGKGKVSGPSKQPANMPEFRGVGGFDKYRNAARSFMSGSGPRGSITLPGTSPGSFFRVDPSTGYFGYMNSSGTISTFFRPHSDPMQYFWEQFK
ncbi:RHS repeat-associated core domain-containing protein [Streptomyces sp. NBC_00996]|uniref:RHS repeat protein n=1 Tax=Streptomyces sp. NBC_00996 TaxID=2903710 RepID=UPI0038631EB2|nr:hypothetical protein OG390_05580 [Streptomyces sp. NBC_00996]